jgi:putative FmdB family regulatory protein
MPFYEYECQSCKFYTELLQKVSDAPLKKCPSCGKSTMKKLVSAPVFRLKGGGWYETDFKGDKENKRNLAVEKEPDTVSESKPAKSDAKADAKPATEAKPAAESKPEAAKSASKSRAKPAAKSKARPAPRKGK